MEEMTSRERVLKALNHQEADRVSVDLGGWQSGISYLTYQEVKKILGVHKPTRIEEKCQGLALVDEEVLQQFRVDTRYIFPNAPPADNPFEKVEDSFTDEWGVVWNRPASSVYYDMVGFPLKEDESSLYTHSWPEPSAIASLDDLVAEWKKSEPLEKAMFTSLAGCFEQATYIRGMEDFYMDAYINPGHFAGLLDKVLEIELERYSLFFDAVGDHLDVVEFWGDLGTQLAPLVSPVLYREVIMPRERQLVDLVKKKTNAMACLHSCGASYEFIPYVLEAGYEVLNPVQTTAAGMDPVRLKKEFGKEITFWGAIDTQKILPFGTVQEVKDEVKRIIDILAPEGGFILAPCHNIQAQTPPENVIALFEAAIEFGRY